MAIRVRGARQFSKRIELLRTKGRITKGSQVTVGFAMPYAVYVHEDLTKWHRSPTRAKFLETASAQTKERLKQMIIDRTAAGIAAGQSRDTALLEAQRAAGWELLQAALLITPIETGGLRASGFTGPTTREAELAYQALATGMSIRTSKRGSKKTR